MNRKKISLKVAILIDNPFRDLPGLVLVASELVQYKIRCYLVPMNYRDEIWFIKPNFVLLNHFRTIYEDFVSDIKNAGIKVGVLDTEGGVFSPIPNYAHKNIESEKNGTMLPPIEEYALSMTTCIELRSKIDCFFSWSEYFSDYAIKNNWYNAKQIHTTGTPRLDFYNERFKNVVIKNTKFIDNFKKPIIMINSNFPLANSKFLSPAEEMNMIEKNYGYRREYLEELNEKQYNAMISLSELTNNIAKEFPEVTFIFRPHPFEEIKTYADLLDLSKNIFLEKKGTVDGWLLRSIAVVLWGSSTAIDAGLLGVPAFIPDWIPKLLPIPEVDQISIHCSSEEELKNRVSKILSGDKRNNIHIRKNINEIIERAYYKIDGNAHRRIAKNIILTIDKKKEIINLNVSFFKKKNKKLLLANLIKKIKRCYLSLSIKSKSNMISWRKSDKYFSASQVRKLLNDIKECKIYNKNHNNITVRRNMILSFPLKIDGKSIKIEIK